MLNCLGCLHIKWTLLLRFFLVLTRFLMWYVVSDRNDGYDIAKISFFGWKFHSTNPDAYEFFLEVLTLLHQILHWAEHENLLPDICHNLTKTSQFICDSMCESTIRICTRCEVECIVKKNWIGLSSEVEKDRLRTIKFYNFTLLTRKVICSVHRVQFGTTMI